MFSFWAPLGDAGVAGFPSRGAYRMKGVQLFNPSAKTLYSCGSGDPVVRYNAAFGVPKSMAKTRFPQFFLGFMPFFPIFACFYPYFPAFPPPWSYGKSKKRE
jgi:hypothetical protein